MPDDQIPLNIQTMYAELVERAHLARISEDCEDPAGIFVKRNFNERVYYEVCEL